jgi:hypothetical protein
VRAFFAPLLGNDEPLTPTSDGADRARHVRSTLNRSTRTLAVRADREQRTVSQLVRILLRDVLSRVSST